MRALWLDGQSLSLRDVPMPDTEDGDLLLRVRHAGICGTDLALMAGYYDFRGVPGHEFVATVVEGPQHLVGSRVVAEINLGCGRCDFCRQGLRNHCSVRRVIGIKDHGGAFAEFVRAPAENVHAVPDSVCDRDAVLVEPLAAALEILEQVSVDERSRVLIVGAGRLAQLIAQVLRTCSPAVDVLARNPARRPALTPLDVRCVDRNSLPGDGYDLVVEATGDHAGLDMALAAVRPRGTLVMKSTYAGPVTFDASGVVVNEIALRGSRCGPFERALRWLSEGRLALSHLAFVEFPLAQYEAAFAAARDPDIYKVLFSPTTE